MQPRRYSTFELALWKGYLISATPLVVMIGFGIVLAVSQFFHPKTTTAPSPDVSHGTYMEGLRIGTALLLILISWWIGAKHFEAGLPKSRKEFFYLLASLASLSYLGLGSLLDAADDQALIHFAMLLVSAIFLLPAVFLLVLVAARSY